MSNGSARAMRIDLDRVAAKAIDTTLNGGERPHRHRRALVRTVAAGAVVLAAARVGRNGLPSAPLKLMKLGTKTLGELREVTDTLRDRLSEPDDDYEEPYDEEDEELYDDEPGEDDEDDGEPEPEEDQPQGRDGDEEEADDGQEDPAEEGDQDLAGDEEDSGEGQDPKDAEEIHDLQTGIDHERSGVEQAPDLLMALGASRRRPPVMTNGSDRLDPASRPPQPAPRNSEASKPRTR